jgi:hypothetical protein
MGEDLITKLAQRLVRAFARQNIRYMRASYLAFSNGSALPEIRQALPGELNAKRQAPLGNRVHHRSFQLSAGRTTYSSREFPTQRHAPSMRSKPHERLGRRASSNARLPHCCTSASPTTERRRRC